MARPPTPQRNHRSPEAARPRPRIVNSTEHQAFLAARLTARDRWLLRMLHEHRVLTSHQITDLAFPSGRATRQRLLELFTWSLLDRFQPFAALGAAPMHYVLAPAGASVLAAEEGLDVRDLGYRRERAFGIAYSLRLAHTVGVNTWFTSLVHRARCDTASALSSWWSETRVARHFGDLVRPDAYGRWQTEGREVEFFLEYDTGSEALRVVTAKLHGYARLAEATGITTPILLWLPTARRETGARRALARAWADLDHPERVPVATATPEPPAGHANPADAVWLPLDATGAGGRRPLHRLPDAWPYLGPASVPNPPSAPGDPGPSLAPTLPPPDPMPPSSAASTTPYPGKRVGR
ncbi:replication-relaxation family protein [Actinoalloteichus caeruleus]|uniref:replication-relaxation family protein n=1 Tax=Actinoalloteichus cyanogriseus TaxID=2893586 RepID=UPI003BB91AC8